MKSSKLLLTMFLFLFSLNLFSQSRSEGKLSKADISKIRKMVQKEVCSDLENRLYIIDGIYALWIRKGNCSDNSYAYTLFGRGVKTLCYQRETLAGPDTKCSKENESFFNTLIGNLDKKNLGLPGTVKVLTVHSFRKKNTP